MAQKPVARVGDAGSHGGTIISGSDTIKVNNLPIATIGSIYNCPEHGPNPIITGAESSLGGGKLVAHVGSKTACGAIITSGSPDTFIDVPSHIKHDIYKSFYNTILEETTYIEFQLVTEDNKPIPYEKFKLILPNKKNIFGELDHDGFIRINNIPRGICTIIFPNISHEKVIEYDRN